MNPAWPQLGVSFFFRNIVKALQKAKAKGVTFNGFWRIALLCFALLRIALHCFALLCFALLCIALHCFALLRTALHWFALLCIALLCFALHWFALHWFALLCIALLCFALLCSASLIITAGCEHLIFQTHLRYEHLIFQTHFRYHQLRRPKTTPSIHSEVIAAGSMQVLQHCR